MAFKVHEVTRYRYLFDARLGTLSTLSLYGATGTIALVKFVDDDAPVPAPKFSADLRSADIAFKRSAAADLIDMLRNESPVMVTINNQPPGHVFVQTGLEPAGEGESGGS